MILTPSAMNTLRTLRERAEQNVVPLADLAAALERDARGDPPEDDLNTAQTVMWSDGLKVTFTVEEQPIGTCRHVSISMKGQALPPIGAVDSILLVMGFTQSIETLAKHGFAYMEHRCGAVNLIEPLDPVGYDWAASSACAEAAREGSRTPGENHRVG